MKTRCRLFSPPSSLPIGVISARQKDIIWTLTGHNSYSYCLILDVEQFDHFHMKSVCAEGFGCSYLLPDSDHCEQAPSQMEHSHDCPDSFQPSDI